MPYSGREFLHVGDFALAERIVRLQHREALIALLLHILREPRHEIPRRRRDLEEIWIRRGAERVGGATRDNRNLELGGERLHRHRRARRNEQIDQADIGITGEPAKRVRRIDPIGLVVKRRQHDLFAWQAPHLHPGIEPVDRVARRAGKPAGQRLDDADLEVLLGAGGGGYAGGQPERADEAEQYLCDGHFRSLPRRRVARGGCLVLMDFLVILRSPRRARASRDEFSLDFCAEERLA